MFRWPVGKIGTKLLPFSFTTIAEFISSSGQEIIHLFLEILMICDEMGLIGTAEPVFGNICSTLGLDRFTLRGKRKVNTQWLLYCAVHNLFKVHRYGLELA